jgi:Flp pilus assembly protein TadG
MNRMRRHQSGLAAVEFAIVAALLLTLLLGVIEFGRALFISNALTESTRRGARMAAVCPVGDIRPAQVAIFANAGGASRIAPDLTTSNVTVSYLNASGTVIANPAAAANFVLIRYVRVQITGYTMQLMIPFIMPSISMPAFTATLPIESLGYSPTQQAFVACTPV